MGGRVDVAVAASFPRVYGRARRTPRRRTLAGVRRRVAVVLALVAVSRLRSSRPSSCAAARPSGRLLHATSCSGRKAGPRWSRRHARSACATAAAPGRSRSVAARRPRPPSARAMSLARRRGRATARRRRARARAAQRPALRRPRGLRVARGARPPRPHDPRQGQRLGGERAQLRRRQRRLRRCRRPRTPPPARGRRRAAARAGGRPVRRRHRAPADRARPLPLHARARSALRARDRDDAVSCGPAADATAGVREGAEARGQRDRRRDDRDGHLRRGRSAGLPLRGRRPADRAGAHDRPVRRGRAAARALGGRRQLCAATVPRSGGPRPRRPVGGRRARPLGARGGRAAGAACPRHRLGGRHPLELPLPLSAAEVHRRWETVARRGPTELRSPSVCSSQRGRAAAAPTTASRSHGCSGRPARRSPPSSPTGSSPGPPRRPRTRTAPPRRALRGY